MSTPVIITDQLSRYAIDMYDERDALGLSTGFLSFFGRTENGSRTVFSPNALDVQIDIIRGNEKTAAFVKRGSVGINLDQSLSQAEKHTQFDRVFPLIEEKSILTSAQIKKVMAGESHYSNMSDADRLREYGLKTFKEHIRRIMRLKELKAAEAILSGTMTDTATGLDFDFKRLSTNIWTVTNKWTSGSQVILTDLGDSCQKVRAAGKLNPDMAVFGNLAFDAVLKDSNVKAIADNKGFGLISIGQGAIMPAKYQRFVDAGMVYQGRMRLPNGYQLECFTYNDGYDLSGTFTNYMPSKKVLICSTDARCDRYFGPDDKLPATAAKIQMYQQYFGLNPSAPAMPMNIKNERAVLVPEAFTSDAFYASSDEKSIALRTQIAPIFAPVATDGFVTMTVLD